MSATRRAEPAAAAPDVAALAEIERRVLWLAVRMVDHANRERPAEDPLKVGGHQASSASLASVMTALWFAELRPGDRVSVKPHASPVLHAVEYLLGWLDEPYLRRLRDLGGLQAYPSRTKDPLPVDYSTGSVGLGAVAPLFGALTGRYLEAHFGRPHAGREFALVGDAELDEGNVWEAILDPVTRGLGEVVWIVDLNRQSLDRVVPLIRTHEFERTFESAGWRTVELKYGRRLREAFATDGGDLLRRRIDELSNQEYQALFSAGEERVRGALERTLSPAERRRLRAALEPHDGAVGALIRDLGGHDLADLCEALAATRERGDRPTVIFAYTVKGYRLPIAGHPLNHSANLTGEQIDALRAELDVDPDDEWARLGEGAAGGRLCAEAARRLGEPRRPRPTTLAAELPPGAERTPRGPSTQEAFGRVLTEIRREAPALGERIVTAAPDVSVSTNLGGWINRVGIYGASEEAAWADEGEALAWRVSPQGQHIELGISEMNLFLLLSQLGLARETHGEPLLPVGTVYDPFVCRGLDALIYALYAGACFVVAGTPSGVTLSREGGAHQSLVTPSIGLELPGLVYAEPTYPAEVDWLVRDALRRIAEDDDAVSLYLRLSTRPVDAEPFERLRAGRGDDALRADVLAGGYRAVEPAAGAAAVTLVSCGALVPEAMAAADLLAEEEGLAASVVALTSPDRAYHGWRRARLGGVSDPSRPPAASHLERLLAPDGAAPIVSVIDGASHTLAFVGGAVGRRQVTLGVDAFGQSGALAPVYDHYEISPDAVAAAAVAALAG